MITFMRRMALICAVLWLTPQATATAQAAYLNEAVQALQSGNVYVSVQVSDIDTATKEQLVRQADANNVAVVALPSDAASEAGGNPTEFARSIATATGDNTLVLAIGNDLVAVDPSGVAGKLADKAESESGSTGEALLNFIAEVREAKPGPSSSQPSAAGGGDGLGLAVIAMFVVIAGGFAVVLRRLSRSRHPALPERIPAPDEIRKLLSEIQVLGGNIKNVDVQRNLSEGNRHTEQLFSDLKEGGSNRIQEITATYAGYLTELRKVLVELKKVEATPEYYQPKTDELLQRGYQAVQNYEAGTLRDARNVKTGNLTDFQVSVKLLSAMNPSQDPRL